MAFSLHHFQNEFRVSYLFKLPLLDKVLNDFKNHSFTAADQEKTSRSISTQYILVYFYITQPIHVIEAIITKVTLDLLIVSFGF